MSSLPPQSAKGAQIFELYDSMTHREYAILNPKSPTCPFRAEDKKPHNSLTGDRLEFNSNHDNHTAVYDVWGRYLQFSFRIQTGS